MVYPIRLFIADDHEIFRDGLALMLSKQKDIELIGQAENGRELIEKVELLLPDLILTDIKMPLMDGVEATRQILKKNPTQKIIALSMFDEENLIVDMLEAGARGYSASAARIASVAPIPSSSGIWQSMRISA